MKTKIFTLISVISFSIYNSEASIDGYINDNRDGLENNNHFVTPKKERNKEIECPNAPERRKCHAKKQYVSGINLSRIFNREIDSRRLKSIPTPPKNFDTINGNKNVMWTPIKDRRKEMAKNGFISETVDNASLRFCMTIDELIQELQTPPQIIDIIINGNKDFMRTPIKEHNKEMAKNGFISETIYDASMRFGMTINGLIQELKTYKEYNGAIINNFEEEHSDFVGRRLDFDSSDGSEISDIHSDENYTSSDEKCISSDNDNIH